MRPLATLSNPGVLAALVSALLFGLATPASKALLGAMDPLMLAGMLYLGSGIGLAAWRAASGAPAARLAPAERPWFAGAVLFGGVLGPFLLLHGLARLGAAESALLLNAEGVFTALIAWIVFRENVDRRVALGMAAVVAGCVALTTGGRLAIGDAVPSLLVLAACLCWAIDNNLTRQVSLTDAGWIASVKGLVAGGVNVALALATGAAPPAPAAAAGAMAVGFVSYGVSLTLFVVALRHLGAARTGAYYSTAPFFGAALALGLGEPVTASLLVAGALMALGLWLHLAEHHAHEHRHEALEHAHWHWHDLHHAHAHGRAARFGHSHAHRHEALVHAHPHFPDAHHRHRHG